MFASFHSKGNQECCSLHFLMSPLEVMTGTLILCTLTGSKLLWSPKQGYYQGVLKNNLWIVNIPTLDATIKHLFPTGQGIMSQFVSKSVGTSTSHSDNIIWSLYALGFRIFGTSHSIASPSESVSVSSSEISKSFSSSLRQWLWKSYRLLRIKLFF